MRLHWLRVKNFRQFYGTSPKIEFASGEKNVTVIHGYNGSGKTALLNAFTWLLYGEFSAGFQQEDQLVNKRAIREAAPGETIEAEVELMFEHIGKQYLIQKKYHIEKGETNAASLNSVTIGPEMQWSDADGKWMQEKKPGDVIGRILPKELHYYFFFDGERIDKFFNPSSDAKKNMAQALKQFLGIEPLERAEKHLKVVMHQFENELQKIGDPETKLILEKKNHAEKQLDLFQTRRVNMEEDIEVEKEQKRRIEKQLREHKEATELQDRRDQLDNQKESLIKTERELKSKLSSHISAKGYVVFLKKISTKFHEMENSLRKAGELPSGIKRKFVQDLLEAGKCICGTELTMGSNKRKVLEEWLSRAGLAEVEERLLKLGGRMDELDHGQIEDFYQLYNNFLTDIEKARIKRSAIEEELDDVYKKLGESSDIQVRELEVRHKRAEENVAEFRLELGGINRDIEQTTEAISQYENELEKKKERKSKSELAKRRLLAAKDARVVIRQMREALEIQNIQAIDRKLKERFKKMTYVPYVPELREDLSITLLESAGGDPMPVAASQGECQLMSFAFLATIIEYAREWQQKQDDIHHLDSSKYPIVMDSPFGSLDPYYRSQVSTHVPELADQVVILVTLTQWRGEVEEKLSGRIGKQYVLEYHSPEDTIPDEVINIGNISYPLIKKSSNDYEYTEIIEVQNG